MKVKFKLLENGRKEWLPKYMSKQAAGADLYNVESSDVLLEPGSRFAFSTGFAMELPVGYEAQIRPRSGLAIKSGVTVVNAPGTIDADYRGPVKVALVNTSTQNVVIKPGDRIAQMVIAKVEQPEFEIVDDLTDTERGAGGFGSTGSR